MWPQIILLTLYFVSLLIAANEHGEPRKPGNFWLHLVALIIVIGLLYWGNFFDGFWGEG